MPGSTLNQFNQKQQSGPGVGIGNQLAQLSRFVSRSQSQLILRDPDDAQALTQTLGVWEAIAQRPGRGWQSSWTQGKRAGATELEAAGLCWGSLYLWRPRSRVPTAVC